MGSDDRTGPGESDLSRDNKQETVSQRSTVLRTSRDMDVHDINELLINSPFL